MVAKLFDHWKFRISGTIVEFLEFPDDRLGEMKYMFRVDYFGGKYTIDLSQTEYNHLSTVVKSGTDCRVFGDILQSNGRPRLRNTDLEISGIKTDMKPINDEERMLGGYFEGCGELVSKREYLTKSGVRYQVSVRSIGGIVELLVDEQIYQKLPAKGLFMVVGRLTSTLERSFVSGKVRIQSQLEYDTQQMILVDVNGIVINNAKKSA
ncbi:MAG: hypothetical protein LBE13_02080 [Bacteroidales bacterium]|jgi:hypothetical protein|nr:hypothetical protein [Bacteroidales bacterium]